MNAATDRVAFIRAHTQPERPPLVPEIVLQLATEITPLWQATEDHLSELGIEPPFWAFAWPGSQLIAREILDNPGHVRGKRVLDFACGSGLAGIACMQAGASHTLCNDIDPLAIDATLVNAHANDVTLSVDGRDLVGCPSEWDLILCGDICYNAPMAARIMPWLRSCAKTTEVWVADPGRTYGPDRNMDHTAEAFVSYDVPTLAELEDRQVRKTTLYRVKPG